MIYRQCKLLGEDTGRETIGWIEGWAARPKVLVKIPDIGGGDEWFKIAEVYSAMDGEALRAKQAADRNAFSSLNQA